MAQEPAGPAGTVTAGDKAGDLEATLLAMKAVKAAASQVAGRVPCCAGTSVLVMTHIETPTFHNAMAYDAMFYVVDSALDAAIKAGREFTGERAMPTVQSLGAAGEALESATHLLGSLNNLLSFLRTDITLQGVEVSLDARVGVQEVANALAEKKCKVTLPAIYNRAALQTRAEDVIADATGLATKRATLATLITAVAAEAAKRRTSFDWEPNAEKKRTLEKPLSDATALLSSLEAASALADAWHAALSAADGKGLSLVNVIREKAIADALRDGALLLLVTVEKAGGAVMTKKNLWTFFGEMPIYHMGGAALSFTAIDGKDGLVKAAGVVPIHGGFVKAGKVAAQLEAEEPK